MKKKILTISLVIILLAALFIGGTLAYMTDRDEATNTFTVGNVDIKLNEVYTPNSQLMPGVVVDKDITIENVGINNAWVWYTYAVPTELVPYIEAAFENASDWTYAGAIATDVADANGVKYTVFAVLYNSTIAAGQETKLGMTSVTLSPTIDVDAAGKLKSVVAGVVTEIDWNYTVSPVVYVNAYAIQQEGFGTVQAAYDAYVGQWGQLQLSWAN